MNNNTDKENPKRDAFSFFWSFKDAIMGLEDEKEKLAIYEALTDYAFLGIEPTDLTPICKIIWKLVKPNIDSSIRRYDACVNNGKKGAEYGSLGGRPKNKKATKKNPKETPEETPEETPKETPEETPKETPEETPKKPLNKNKNKDKDKNKDLKENNHMHDYERNQISFPTISEDFLNFNKWLKENCPFVLKVATQMTEKQYNQILGQYSKTDLCEVLQNLNNWKDFPKKRTSVYISVIDELKKKGGNNGTARGFKNAV